MSALTERLTHSSAAPAAWFAAKTWRVASTEAMTRLKAFAKTLTRRKAIFDLGRLDDRMLADIGLTRADIDEASRWSLWGDGTDRLTQAAEERRRAGLSVG